MGKTILAAIVAAGVILAGCEGGPDPAAVRAAAERQAVSLEATRTATALQATRTALDLERKAFDLERARGRADSLDVFLMALPWVILLVGLGACVVVGYCFMPILVQKVGLVTRRAEDGETVLLLGKHRFALPLRSAGAYLDLTPGAERAPLLASSPELQERATMRQQAANVLLASQAAGVTEARQSRGGTTIVIKPETTQPAALPARADRQEPGLLGPVQPDAIPPKLLEAVTSEWEEVEEEV